MMRIFLTRWRVILAFLLGICTSFGTSTIIQHAYADDPQSNSCDDIVDKFQDEVENCLKFSEDLEDATQCGQMARESL